MDQVIPLTNEPNQTLGISLSVNGTSVQLILTIRYNEMAQYWVMDIQDANQNYLVMDIPLLTGVYPAANILGQWVYLNIGSAYVLDVSSEDKSDYPNVTNLYPCFQLLWGDNA